MNKSKFFSLVDTLSILAIAGYLIFVGMTKKTMSFISFFIENGLAFLKWGAAVLSLYGVGYFFTKPIRSSYWLIITLVILLSRVGKELIKLTE